MKPYNIKRRFYNVINWWYLYEQDTIIYATLRVHNLHVAIEKRFNRNKCPGIHHEAMEQSNEMNFVTQ